MRLSFHGAAQNVTGSCFLLNAGGLKILIDWGMFQGMKHADEENADALGFTPSELDFLLLTHAHLDHCGRIPLLVKRGFTGEIITTAATRDLAKLIMMDSAKIQEEDAARASRRRRRGGQSDVQPLYSQIDVLSALDRFGRCAAYDQDIHLNDAVTIRFINAGHILGSASIIVETGAPEPSRRIVFSGDIGSPGHKLLANATPPPPCDYVVMETTYGDRMHRDLDASVEELTDAIKTTIAKGGNVIIPTFAMERTQEILFYLKHDIFTCPCGQGATNLVNGFGCKFRCRNQAGPGNISQFIGHALIKLVNRADETDPPLVEQQHHKRRHYFGQAQFFDNCQQHLFACLCVVKRVCECLIQCFFLFDQAGNQGKLIPIALRLTVLFTDEQQCFGITPCDRQIFHYATTFSKYSSTSRS